MEKPIVSRKRAVRFIGGLALWAMAAYCLAGAAPKQPNNANVNIQDMSSILGEGSQLIAAPDGEFNITMGDDNQLDTFRAVKDVVLVSKDNDLNCDELVYDRKDGKLTATAEHSGLVYITMRNSNSDKTTQSATRATCRLYEYYINEKRHVLKSDPTIYQKDKGKTAAISGREITMTQDASGKWRMHVKGAPQIFDPSRKKELERARQMRGGTKPSFYIDTQPKPEKGPVIPPPRLPASPTTGTIARTVKIDEGNVDKAAAPRSPRIARLEEGG
jgi:hypothetical protein